MQIITNIHYSQLGCYDTVDHSIMFYLPISARLVRIHGIQVHNKFNTVHKIGKREVPT